MKLFTVAEANTVLPAVRDQLLYIQRQYQVIDGLREQARCAASASEAGGGMAGGTDYIKALYEVGKTTTEIHQLGVQLKDHSRGLIDFPSIRDGKVVLLCWQLGEGDEIEWWHEMEAGFAGRQRLK
ncbi:MAG: DUF2203 domain-containing protein [Chloracidobacterium sp.]|nr:DUF2203 domain-containing protein [Chloracidobacterium sp.]